MNPTLTGAIPFSESISLILPEITLAVGAMALLMFGVFRSNNSLRLVAWASVALLALTGFLVMGQQPDRSLAFDGGFVVDPFSQFVKILILLGSGFSIMMSLEYLKSERLERFEYPILVVLATLGMCMMVSANDLITLYVGLELQSLSLYVLAAFNRDSLRSTEAGLKYFVLGALSSGLLLYGASLIYGFTGTTNFDALRLAIVPGEWSLGLIFGVVFLTAGLAFKVSAVPFHMWTPDVYEGAPTPITALFAAAPKVAAMALMVRVLMWPFSSETGIAPEWQQIIIAISILSMVVGAFAAIGQTNIKRLMAYSSIGHMGFVLMGLSAGNEEGVQGVLIYMTIYLFMTLGTFACILSMRRKQGAVEEIEELAGLSRNQPVVAAALAILMFSLAGIPPLAGFFAKFYVIIAAVSAELYLLAIVGVLSSVVGAYYYLRIVKIMYFDEPVEAFDSTPGPELRLVLGVSSTFVLFFFVFVFFVVTATGGVSKALF